MKKSAWILFFAAIAASPIPSHAEEQLFYFDMGAYKSVEGKPRELSIWRGFCSTHPKSGESCSIDIVGFECKPKGTPRINNVTGHSSWEKTQLFELLGPIDFKKRSFDFRIVLSADELTCFIQSDGFGKQKPNLKCTGLDHKKSPVLIEIIPKRSTIVELCGDLAIEGRE